MDFELSEEQRLLKDSVERLTTQRYDFEARKKFMKEADGWSRALWQQYADLGLTAAARFGGTVVHACSQRSSGPPNSRTV